MTFAINDYFKHEGFARQKTIIVLYLFIFLQYSLSYQVISSQVEPCRTEKTCPVLPCPARTGQDQVDKFLQVRLKFWKS